MCRGIWGKGTYLHIHIYTYIYTYTLGCIGVLTPHVAIVDGHLRIYRHVLGSMGMYAMSTLWWVGRGEK